jgi:hypothetical protein
MALIRVAEAPSPGAVDFGTYPNPISWSVFDPSDQAVGQVSDVYVHTDIGGIAYLLVWAAGGDREFAVPIMDATLNEQKMEVRVRRRLGEYPPEPRLSENQPRLIREFLARFGVRDEAIDRIEAAGITSLEELRRSLENGRLVGVLGEENRADIASVTRVIDLQRL